MEEEFIPRTDVIDVKETPWWRRPVDPEWSEPIEVKQARWLKNLREKIEKEKADEAAG